MSARIALVPLVLLAGCLAACSPGAAPASTTTAPATPATAAPAADLSKASLDGDMTLFGVAPFWMVTVTGADRSLAMERPMFNPLQFGKSEVAKTGDAVKFTAKDDKNSVEVSVTKKSCEPGMGAPAFPFETSVTFVSDESKYAKTFKGCGGPGIFLPPGHAAPGTTPDHPLPGQKPPSE